METTLVPANTNKKERDLFRTISLAALLTGTLDLIAANIQFYFTTQRGATLKLTGIEEPVSIVTYLLHGGPEHILKYIASGVFVAEANTGSNLMVIWGAVFHYMIAFLFALCLFVAYPSVLKWCRSKFIVAAIYGLVIWAIMDLAVVPLSKINRFPSDWKNEVTGELILTIAIGLPLALIADRFYAGKKAV